MAFTLGMKVDLCMYTHGCFDDLDNELRSLYNIHYLFIKQRVNKKNRQKQMQIKNII